MFHDKASGYGSIKVKCVTKPHQMEAADIEDNRDIIWQECNKLTFSECLASSAPRTSAGPLTSASGRTSSSPPSHASLRPGLTAAQQDKHAVRTGQENITGHNSCGSFILPLSSLGRFSWC